MQGFEQVRMKIGDALVFLIAAALMVTALQVSFYAMPTPTLDALRYVDYALNIHDHGVFGLSGARRDREPAPGNANSPLYPALLASAIALDPELEASVRCAVTHRQNAQTCPHDYGTIIAIQNTLVVAALFCIWVTALRMYPRRLVAWLTGVFVLASTKPLFFANSLLTEILVLFLFAVLMLALVAAYDSERRRWWVLAGASLAALTLTRPEYLYLAGALATLGLGVVLVRGWKRAGSQFAAAVIAFAMLVGPWSARNVYHFGTPAITGGYGDVIIAYRAAYNRMSFAEWAAAFVYWLPGHGEQLAAALLPPASYARLGTDPDSYLYRDGGEIFSQGLAAVDGDRERLTGYLLRTEILEHPLRHAFTSLPLAWRGILAGKYLAVFGLPCALYLLVYSAFRRQWRFVLLAVPAVVMVALYAAISVSIPRYNVYLVYYYALALAWSISSYIDHRPIAERGRARR